MKIDSGFIDSTRLKALRRGKTTMQAFAFIDRMKVVIQSVTFLQDASQSPTTNELLRHIPTASVAALQGFMTDLIARLIDNNQADRSSTVFKDIQFSVESVLQSRAVNISVGHIAANALRLNTLTQINEVMSKLLSIDFHDRLKDIQLPIKDGTGGDEPLTLRTFEEQAFPALQAMFVTRNIVCHELAPEVVVSAKDAYAYAIWTLMYGCASEGLAGAIPKRT